MKLLKSLAFAAVAAIAAIPAAAQDWPTRPITLIYPFGAGPGDIIARQVAASIEKEVGQPVALELLAGAGGVIGGAKAAQAAPDGYTIFWGTSSNLSATASLYNNPPYDPFTAFDPIVWLGDFSVYLLVRNDLPVKDMKEFVEYTKANPGQVKMAVSHHSARLLTALMEQDGLSFNKVPYKTDPEMTPDVLGGRVDALWATGQWAEYVKTGQLRALAVSTKERNPAMPDVPTMKESGLPEVPLQIFFGLAAPKGTPKEIIERINKAVYTGMQTNDDLKKAYELLKAIPAPESSPEVFGEILKKEAAIWAEFAPIAGIEKQ